MAGKGARSSESEHAGSSQEKSEAIGAPGLSPLAPLAPGLFLPMRGAAVCLPVTVAEVGMQSWLYPRDGGNAESWLCPRDSGNAESSFYPLCSAGSARWLEVLRCSGRSVLAQGGDHSQVRARGADCGVCLPELVEGGTAARCPAHRRSLRSLCRSRALLAPARGGETSGLFRGKD